MNHIETKLACHCKKFERSLNLNLYSIFPFDAGKRVLWVVTSYLRKKKYSFDLTKDPEDYYNINGSVCLKCHSAIYFACVGILTM